MLSDMFVHAGCSPTASAWGGGGGGSREMGARVSHFSSLYLINNTDILLLDGVSLMSYKAQEPLPYVSHLLP